MVEDSGAQGSHPRLRALNQPQPVRVEADAEGRPLAVVLRSRRRRVAGVQETWRVEEEWWRERAVSRQYWRLVLEDGQVVTVFEDLVEGGWWRQRV